MKKVSKLKSKVKKRPLSCVNKKTQYSGNNLPFSFSQKIPQLKFTNKEYKRNISKGNLTERKFNNDLANLSYKLSTKEKKPLNVPQYFSKVETPKKIIYNHLLEKNIKNNEELGLFEFLIINNESIAQKRVNSLKKVNKAQSTSRLSSAGFHNNFSDFQIKTKNNNSFINKNNKNNKNIFNLFRKYEREIIKKKILNNTNINKEINSNNNISLDISKKKSITYKSLFNNSSRIKNFSEINSKEIIDNKEKEKETENDNICQNIDINTVETDSIKIKNTYLIKFANIAELYKKFFANSDWIRVDFRKTFLNILTNVFKSLEEYNKFILYKYKINDILSTDIWASSLKSFHDFCGNVLKWQKLMIDEIRFVKKENIYLNKKLFHIENDLDVKDQEIKDINKNIIKYDLDKVKYGKIAYEKVEKVKNDYINHESNYVLTIYQLENELKQLSEVLRKNKVDKNYLDNLQKKFNSIRDEYDKNKADYKEYEYQSENKIMLLTQYNNELNQKINNLENELKSIKDKENGYMEEIIILKSKIDYLNKMVNQKEINISQLKIEINKLTEMKRAGMLQPAKTIFIPCH